MSLDLTPLGGRLAARLDGVSVADLAAGDPELTAAVRAALHEHLVLVLPPQPVDDDALAAAVGSFGDLYVHPIARLLGVTEGRVEHIIDDADHPPYQDGWHTDVSWDERPPSIGCLQAVQMPDRGGETLWASMYDAYDALSDPMRAAIEPLVGVHAPGLLKAFVTKVGPEIAAAIDERYPGTEHPVVGTHPATGRPYLDVNPTFTTHLAGMHPAESRLLLGLLTSRDHDPSIQYRHRWTEGEVVLWDERATQHYATSDHFPRRREVARATVA